MNDILLNDADRCMGAYECGVDRSEGRLVLALTQVQVAYEREANIDN